jgi:hypothetical protein
MEKLIKNCVFKTFGLFLIVLPLMLSGQNASLTLKDFDLKGNVKEVSEAVVDYSAWKKEARTRLNKIYKFDKQGFLTYIKSDPEAFQGNDYIYETFYSYKNNYSEMIITSNTFNNGAVEIDKESVEVYNLIKTGIGYLQDYKASPSIKRNTKGEITDYTWYSPKSTFGSSIYTFEYKDGFIYETKTPLVTTRYNANGVKEYDFVIGSAGYYYYNQDGFLYKHVLYPLGNVVYYRYEYTNDNRGNWIQKRKYTYYTGSSARWEIKEIEYRKITYHDGVVTGSDVFNQKDLDDAIAIQSSLSVWTDDPRAIDNRIANQGCVKGNCVDGFGKMNYENGVYEGFFKNSKRHGFGFYQWNDKSTYLGNWENDKLSGFGLYDVKDNPKMRFYTGYFSNGNYEGKGLLMTDKRQIGIFKNGTLVTRMDFYSNDTKTGCTAGDCQNGYGRFIFNNGDQFDGFFQNGKLSSGNYIFSSGGTYSGEFNASNQFHGYGSYGDGKSFMQMGEWVNGAFQGLGLYFETVTQKYNAGIWENGNLVQRYEY